VGLFVTAVAVERIERVGRTVKDRNWFDGENRSKNRIFRVQCNNAST